MSRPRLLLIPSFTELEWQIKPQLEEWAEVAMFDAPGVGDEPLPEGVEIDPDLPDSEAAGLLSRWRNATAERALAEVDDRRWESFVIAMDGLGTPAGVRVAQKRRGAAVGLAIGHASLSHSRSGARPAVSDQVWDAMTELMRRDSEAAVKWGLTQMTAGVVDEAAAERLLQKFPDLELTAAVWELLGKEGEPVGEALGELDLPMLLGKHEGCLIHTDEGFEDIVAEFPEATTVECPDGLTESAVFAVALRRFCEQLWGDGN